MSSFMSALCFCWQVCLDEVIYIHRHPLIIFSIYKHCEGSIWMHGSCQPKVTGSKPICRDTKKLKIREMDVV
jgi:hypothetical protein